MDTQHLLMVMVGIFGFSVLLQIFALAGVAVGMTKALKAAKELSDEMHSKLDPVLVSSHELLERTQALMIKLEPKLEAAAGDLADITRTAREETERISASADDITGRLRRQAERMDEMTTSALNSVDRVGHFLNEAVSAPARGISGVVAAARAVINTLRTPTVPRQPDGEEPIRAERQNYV